MDGIYKIELWGAQGKPSSNFASYTSGKISLNKNDKLYVYVGGRDAYNGGASAKEGDTSGGATDVRLVSGSWENITSLRSRIMVAAGSANNSHGGYGAPGGGVAGYDGIPFIDPELTGSDSTGKGHHKLVEVWLDILIGQGLSLLLENLEKVEKARLLMVAPVVVGTMAVVELV